ncbi:MAG: hypothetical protein ACRC8B_22695 [Aeromonas sobria]|uniref:hypothetical protein n=1 Tax=Aeromonas sobria TaxID=646 RepID=UPI003F3F27BC
MTETEKQLAYHRHELNRFRLMGYQDCLANVHREAIKNLERFTWKGPALDEYQAGRVAYWMALRRSALFDALGLSTKLTAVMARGYVEWLITSVNECQCDMRKCDWEVVLAFLEKEGSAFALSLNKVNDVSKIISAIKEEIACPA